MKQHIIDTFRFNDWANKKMLEAMRQLDDMSGALAIFSHIITLQDKWLLRAKRDPSQSGIKWWDTPLGYDELAGRWEQSLNGWLRYLEPLDEAEIGREIQFTPETGDNGDRHTLRNVLLQLNYHSILHRAEIGLRLRDQGVEPPAVDYIYYLPPANDEYPSAAADAVAVSPGSSASL
jgi:uncharacterized damage-inducible protein DinB